MSTPTLERKPAIGPPTRHQVDGVEYFVIGEGGPVTLFAHGVGGSISETRPLAADLGGTRVFLHFRGHGGSAPIPEGWDYDSVAQDLLLVADEVGATRAAGVSMGAGALMRVMVADPQRFARVAFVLPAALTEAHTDGAIERLHLMAEAVYGGDEPTLTALVLAEVPVQLQGERVPQLLAARRAREWIAKPPPFAKSDARPLQDLAELSRMTAPALVVAQESDWLHPTDVARTMAAGLPNADLVTLPPGGVFWTQPEAARLALANHLTPGASDR